jgi:membrane associated rhomboid family serine protease
VAALLTLVLVIVVNLALGLLPRVDNFAHMGSLISGFLLGFVFFICPQFAWLTQQ